MKKPKQQSSAIAAALLLWYAHAKRDLPWRNTRDPYRIWISEVMLQQTRVAAVIPYYQRFLEHFPDVQALSEAPEADLLARWAGLGYYTRARNLQKAAKEIVNFRHYPNDYATIRDLPGVGDYTAAAVASIAFRLPYAVLDGNVARVIARLTAERGNVQSTAIKRRLQEQAQSWLDPAHPGDFNQAIMELGATICLPRAPQCLHCPVAGRCEARRLGIQSELPLKRVRPETIFLERALCVIVERGRVLLESASGGFWELPKPFAASKRKQLLGEFQHAITHHSYRFTVTEATLRGTKPKHLRWHGLRSLDEIPLSTTAKKGIACWKKVVAERERET